MSFVAFLSLFLAEMSIARHRYGAGGGYVPVRNQG